MMQTNPFTPAFGVNPSVFAGREAELAEFKLALYEGVGSPYRALLISGPRGSGKTVLLNQLEATAKESGWVVLRAYANETLLEDLRDTQIPFEIEQLDYSLKKTSRISGVSLAGVGSISTESTAKQSRHTLITKLREAFKQIASKAAGIFITIDELQAAPIAQIAELAVAVQDLMRDGYDIAFAGAGLTFGVETLLEEPGTTFLRRAMRIELGPVSDQDVADSFIATVEGGGKTVDVDAAGLAVSLIHGYPYLLQLVGSKAWAFSEMRQANSISVEDVQNAKKPVIRQMGQQVHKIALKKVPDSQLDYLEAMAEVSAVTGGVATTAEIAEKLGKKQSQVSDQRRKLIERDLIYSAQRGEVEFRLPYLGEYLLEHAR